MPDPAGGAGLYGLTAIIQSVVQALRGIADAINKAAGGNITPASVTTPGKVTAQGGVSATTITASVDAQIPGTVSAASSSLKIVFADARAAAATSVASGSTKIINFDSVNIDTDSAVTTGASWRFTVPAGKGGLYNVQAAVLAVGTSTVGSYVNVLLFKNGSFFRTGGVPILEIAGTTEGPILILSTTVALAAGDFIDIRCSQNTGNTWTMGNDIGSNFVSITRIPGS